MFEPWKSKGVDAPIFMGLGMTATDPCLAGVLHVCSFVLFTIWVTPENRLAKLALRGSSVLTQYFRGPQMACDSGWVKKLSVHVHKPANRSMLSKRWYLCQQFTSCVSCKTCRRQQPLRARLRFI